MGCGVSHEKQDDTVAGVTNLHKGDSKGLVRISTKTEIHKVEDFNMSSIDLVHEKRGKIINDYQLLSPPIGSGAFGEVRKAIHKASGQARAVKIINKSETTEEERQRIENEIEILRTLDHPNIIKIFEFYQDKKFFYIVTDLCTGGELFDKIVEMVHFSEYIAADIMRQLLSAVAYCHKNNIVHRDLKPENVLLESEKEKSLIRIIDFGTSRVYDPSVKMTQKFGTPYYIAPEVLRRKYDQKCDVWSCGVILYVLLCGYAPFNGGNDKVIMEKVAKGTFAFPPDDWDKISDEAKSLIKQMLEFTPEQRCTAAEALQAPWFQRFSENASPVIDKKFIVKSLNNLKTFRAERKLQEATWLFLVSYFTTKEEKDELMKAFKEFDLNGDGFLQKEELIQCYKKTMNAAQAEQEVEKIMQSVDVNHSGQIDYSEWVAATVNRKSLLSKQKLEAAFHMFDQDGNGFISAEELKKMFGDNVHNTVWAALIKEVDNNGDGQISLKEFKDMMLTLG